MTRLLPGAAVALALTLLTPAGRGPAPVSLPAHAQMRVAPLDQEQGHVALGLALRRLATTGVFMQATAHPDDENNALLVMLNRGLGYRTTLATATRGNGGQNEIGPELFEALGVLRTEELHAIHRFDGAEQYFTRAVDFGYSFSIEETFEKWGREEIIGDYVRLIRTVRPDVVLTMRPDGDGGGQHHQASAALAREAFAAAADPARYPEQIEAGLRPWRAGKLYMPAAPGARAVTVNLGSYDRLLGRTYAEIGSEARSMHKCQGLGLLLSLPAPVTASFELVASPIAGQMQRVEGTLFDNINTSIEGLARFAGARVRRELPAGLTAISEAVTLARTQFDAGGAAATLPPLLTGLRAVRTLRGQLRTMEIEESARFEIDFRLRQKEREFQQAIVLAAGVRVEALADDGVVVPGQAVGVSLIVANRGAASVGVRNVSFEGFAGGEACSLTLVPASTGRGGGVGAAAPAVPGVPASTIARDQVVRCEPTLQIPPDVRITEPYWHRDGEAGRYTFDEDAPFGLPYRLSPFYAQVTLSFGTGTEEVYHGLPVQYRYSGNVFSGEKRSELLVVPAQSVRVSPEIVILPASVIPAPPPPPKPGAKPAPAKPTTAKPLPGAKPAPAATAAPAPPPAFAREVRVTVVNGAKGEAESVVKLALPEGWTSTPADERVAFTREDESRTVRFQVTPPPGAPRGEHRIGAVVTAGGQTFTRGYQVIEYPHIRRQHVYRPSEARLKVVDVQTRPNLTVGYIMGVGDEVPAAITQLGVRLEFIDTDGLAWGDLSRFNTIVTGVRAYERRADLRANNSRLLEYVRNGGTLVVQYNKFEFNEAQYGPWAAEVSSDRVTDEFAPVRVLEPADPAFTTPNKIAENAWQGWVQERGLYFLGAQDSRYRPLLAMEDPFPNNPGEKRGALVAAQYGKGRWLYVGLGLWRQLPAGVDGAYQLLANLITPRT
jgi:LmbE family N-acetylglucosaminyl deacetylase